MNTWSVFMILLTTGLYIFIWYDFFKVHLLNYEFIYKQIIKYKYNNCKYTLTYLKHIRYTQYDFINDFSFVRRRKQLSLFLLDSYFFRYQNLINKNENNLHYTFRLALLTLITQLINWLFISGAKLSYYNNILILYIIPLLFIIISIYYLVIKLRTILLLLSNANEQVKKRISSANAESLEMYNINFYESDLSGKNLNYKYKSDLLKENFLNRYIKDFYNINEDDQDWLKFQETCLDYLSKNGLPENQKIHNVISENDSLNILEFLIMNTSKSDIIHIKDLMVEISCLGMNFMENLNDNKTQNMYWEDEYLWLKELKQEFEELSIIKEERKLNCIITQDNERISYNKKRL